ncbi:MAG: peptidylprolyl isomerase [Oscillospiraceae bacterium]
MSNPTFTITMQNGKTMSGELYPEIAPNTVNNFISLVNAGFYNGLIFHRCIPGFMIQGGCPKGTGTGDPGYSIKGEFTGNGFENNLKHDKGVLSMARAASPNSAGSQFFLMVEKAPHLDGQYASFGKLTEGLDVADEIVSVGCDRADRPRLPQQIATITVDTHSVTYPAPEKV